MEQKNWAFQHMPGEPLLDLFELMQFDLPEKMRMVHDHAVHWGGNYFSDEMGEACYFVMELAKILERLEVPVH